MTPNNRCTLGVKEFRIAVVIVTHAPERLRRPWGLLKYIH